LRHKWLLVTICLFVIVLFGCQEQEKLMETSGTALNQEEFTKEIGEKEGIPFELPMNVMKDIMFQYNVTWASELTLEDFEKLEELRISEEFDVDSFVEFIPNLKHLTVEVPLKDWSFLKKLSNIEGISISNNTLEDLTFLSNAKKLSFVYIQGANLKSMKGIEELSNLEFFIIDHSNVTDFSALQKVPQLKSLDIINSELYSLEPIQYLTRLERLSIQGNQVSDLSPLAKINTLKILDIRETNVISIEPILGLEQLNLLLLEKDKVTDWTLLEEKEHLKVVESIEIG